MVTDCDINHLRTWIGKQQLQVDTISTRLVECYNAIFETAGSVVVGEEAPPGIHWCLAPEIAPMNLLGTDGHPGRGGFLPPVPFPRRMWAGGELQFSGRFLVGDDITKHSTVEDVTLKTGRSGSLIFVTVRHVYESPGGTVLTERQDIVYREPQAQAAPAVMSVPIEPPREADRSIYIEATPTLLFRYSAVTYNGHRIHYDRDYASVEEGYPGLVFHGPLQASYLLKLAFDFNGGGLPKSFAFRSSKPLFDGGRIGVHAKHVEAADILWISDQQGAETMTATAKFNG